LRKLKQNDVELGTHRRGPLWLRTQAIGEYAVLKARARGYNRVTRVPMTVSELASDQNLTVQGMGYVLRQLVGMGMLRRVMPGNQRMYVYYIDISGDAVEYWSDLLAALDDDVSS